VANHLPDKKILGAVHPLSCDLLAAALHGNPNLIHPDFHDEVSQHAFDLAQLHMERCQAVYEALHQRDEPEHRAQ
jgi:hypothetical protein